MSNASNRGHTPLLSYGSPILMWVGIVYRMQIWCVSPIYHHSNRSSCEVRYRDIAKTLGKDHPFGFKRAMSNARNRVHTHPNFGPPIFTAMCNMQMLCIKMFCHFTYQKKLSGCEFNHDCGLRLSGQQQFQQGTVSWCRLIADRTNRL